MTKIIPTKNSSAKRKRRPIKFYLFMFGLCMILTIAIGTYYYLTNKPKLEITIFKPCEQETNDLNVLEEKIKVFQEEAKKANLDSETKTNLESIIKKQQEIQTNLKNFITFKNYMLQLENEIQTYEKELKDNEVKKENSLATKHNLEEKKLAKEKELLTLKEKQKLFSEKEELNNHVLQHLKEELKNTQLAADKKTKLEEEKSKTETKITNINKELNNLITKMELKNKIDVLTKEIETEKDEALKKLFIERKAICQKQLEALN